MNLGINLQITEIVYMLCYPTELLNSNNGNIGYIYVMPTYAGT